MSDIMRWTATVFYRTNSGLASIEQHLSELEDLHDLVEAGPHFDTVEQIVVRRTAPMIPDLTVEGAAEL